MKVRFDSSLAIFIYGCLFGVISVGIFCFNIGSSNQTSSAPILATPSKTNHAKTSEHDNDSREPAFITTQTSIKDGSSFYMTMIKLGFSAKAIHRQTKAAKNFLDLNRLSHRTEILLSQDRQTLQPVSLTVKISPLNELILTVDKQGFWSAQEIKKTITTTPVTLEASVTTSLWDTLSSSGLDQDKIQQFIQIFSWQLDFNREVRPDDHWHLIVEKQSIDDKQIGWGNILVAEYKRGDEKFTAIRYPQNSETAGYYDLEGKSVRGKFLKSPLQFARISSTFSKRRYHPILGVNKPHLGVDYAAPTGTPVFSVGDGTIEYIGPRGGSGRMIVIKHNASYKTAYKHLSRFKENLKIHAKVKQGQTIGYVGSTGLATGPHLHFEFFEKEKFVDPLGIKFPKEDSLTEEHLKGFKQLTKALYEKLPNSITPAKNSSPILPGKSPAQSFAMERKVNIFQLPSSKDERQ